jgi:hypothetical protein
LDLLPEPAAERVGDGGAEVTFDLVRFAAMPSAADSPLSSETTALQTVVNPEPGSSVNDVISLALADPGSRGNHA